MEKRTRNRPKHYYAGPEHVATRIGGGGLYAAGVDPELSDRAGKVFCQSLDQVNSRRLKENKPDCIANGLCTHGELLCDIKDIPSRLQADTAIDYTDFRRMIHDMCAIHHDEPDVYFYHSDHLGSASWITDNGGVAVQHLQYLPYGERYVDQRVTGYQERFTFTGKERDEETGYGYFGARYMDHELTTMWLSVDPMSDKYPGISPYAYCAWNPVKLVDPDGKEISPIFSTEGKLLGTDNEGYSGKAIVMEESSFTQGMSHKEAVDKGTFLDEYGSSISISDNSWNIIEANGGVKQKPYLSNKSGERVYFKPDNTKNVFSDKSAYPAEPHMDIYMPIDGVKTAEMKRNEVFKVVDGTRVTVRPNRCVPYTFCPCSVNSRITIGTQSTFSGFFGNILTGGLINAPDPSWYALRDAFITY